MTEHEPMPEIGKVVSTDAGSTREGKPFIVVSVNGEKIGQLTPAECVAMGTRFIQSAIEAERDAGMVTFLRSYGGEGGGMSDEQIAMFISAMRDHRQQAEPKEGLGQLIWHDQIEVNAARALFRIGHRDGHRITDSSQMRHMLHWLAVLLDDDERK